MLLLHKYNINILEDLGTCCSITLGHSADVQKLYHLVWLSRNTQNMFGSHFCTKCCDFCRPPPPGTLGKPGDIFYCHDWRLVCYCYWHLAMLNILQDSSLSTKNYSSPNIKRAEAPTLIYTDTKRINTLIKIFMWCSWANAIRFNHRRGENLLLELRHLYVLQLLGVSFAQASRLRVESHPQYFLWVSGWLWF